MPAEAQDLIELYRAERMNERIQNVRRHPAALPPRETKRLTPPADSIRMWLRRQKGWTPPEPLPPLQVRRWRAVGRLEQPWFESEYGQTSWVFSGATRLTPLDTLFSFRLRARLEDRFGPPTHTTGDYDPDEFEQAASPAQFEYWLVVNDTIPMKVMDANGPFGRGLVVAGARRYKRRLGALRKALEKELLQARPAPFVDYYYLEANREWFRTGYDGEHYFLKPVEAPNLYLGRAWLDDENDARRRP